MKVKFLSSMISVINSEFPCKNIKFIIYTNASNIFYKRRFFSTQLQHCLNFSWNELHMLLRCCLIHKHHHTKMLLYLLNLCPCLDLTLFMSYLCDIFWFSSLLPLWLIVSTHEHRHTYSLAYFLEYLLLYFDDNMDEKYE